jgi:NTE family protein
MKTNPFTLVLGGGGARGIAHLGVLRVLEQKKIYPSLIVGTSMGAIIGAMFCQTLDTMRVEKRIDNLFQSDFFKKIGLDFFVLEDYPERHTIFEQWLGKAKRNYMLSRSITRQSAFPEDILREALSYLIDDMNIADCRIPFRAVATDIRNGDVVVLGSGSLTTAVAASSSIPAITKPVEINKRLLIDGGAACITPVIPAKRISPHPVVAVDVWKSVAHQKIPFQGLKLLLRAGEITQINLNRLLVDQADIIIQPAVQEYSWTKFSLYHELIEKGIAAAESVLPAIECIDYKIPRGNMTNDQGIFKIFEE